MHPQKPLRPFPPPPPPPPPPSSCSFITGRVKDVAGNLVFLELTPNGNLVNSSFTHEEASELTRLLPFVYATSHSLSGARRYFLQYALSAHVPHLDFLYMGVPLQCVQSNTRMGSIYAFCNAVEISMQQLDYWNLNAKSLRGLCRMRSVSVPSWRSKSWSMIKRETVFALQAYDISAFEYAVRYALDTVAAAAATAAATATATTITTSTAPTAFTASTTAIPQVPVGCTPTSFTYPSPHPSSFPTTKKPRSQPRSRTRRRNQLQTHLHLQPQFPEGFALPFSS